MSINKSLKSLILSCFFFLAFFTFGCNDAKVSVNNIKINLESQTQVVLLVDEFYNIGDVVEVLPNYATDKSFTVYTMDENVVRVVGKQIKAVGVGETFVRVVSNSNDNIEDIVSVKVFDTQEQLEAPTGLRYNESDQSFTFNPVDYAVSYSIHINDREFNIGNINTFNLESYVGEKFNNVLTVKVKANAATYSQAYTDSEYCQEPVKIYQASKVEDLKIENGKLLFSTKSDLVYDVYFDDKLFMQETTLGNIDLLSLAEDYAGLSKKVYVISKPNGTIKDSIEEIHGENVLYANSSSNKILLNILDEPDVSIVNGVLSWENIAFASGYEIYLNNSLMAETKKNFFDLKTLEYFNNITHLDGEIEVYVKSKLPNVSQGIAKTTKQKSATFFKLATPTISTAENGVIWNSVENASVYYVEVKKDGVVEFSGNTNVTRVDLSNLGAGNYEVFVMAVGSSGVENYISSAVAKGEIVKRAKVSAQIEDYSLKIQTVAGEKYLINFAIDDKNNYNQIVQADSSSFALDLSVYNFKKGLHRIEITQLGNNSTHINGEIKQLEFTQLEDVSVTISNSVASVTRTSINQNAKIYLETNGTNLAEPIKVEADSCKFNTTDTSKAYLTAGEYSVVAYVCGDGSSTFSYRNLKQALPCGKKEFTVLAIPSLTVLDNSKTEVTVNKVNMATNYTILDDNDFNVANIIEKYSFTLAGGNSCKLKVRANGNGSTTLTSLSSEPITVERLKTPELSFNASNVSISPIYNNDAKFYNQVNFYYEGLKIDDYTFGETFSTLKTGDNNFKISLTSKGKVDGVYYIDSLESGIIVNKLNNVLTANVDENNKLNIANPQNAGLMLDFDFDNIEYTAENGVVAGLKYDIVSTKYIITLLDNNYKAVIADMADGFKVKAKFVKDNIVANGETKTYYTSSDWSDDVELSLNFLSVATEIYADTNNKLIIENPNSEKLYLDLQIDVNGQTLLFKDNGFNELVGEAASLVYNYTAGKYYIDLYQNGNIKLSQIDAGDLFTIKAKFKKVSTASDVDSDFSVAKNVTYLQNAIFIRNGQTLEFTSIFEDYDLDKFNIIVNETSFYGLSEFESVIKTSKVGALTKYSVEITDLWNVLKIKLPSLISTNVNSFKLQTLNTATTKENILLGSIGDALYVQQAQSFNITTRKSEGLTILEIAKVPSNYSKTYSVDILGYKNFSANDNQAISVVLDELEFSGNLVVKGYVKTEDSFILDSKTIQVFDSVMSNSLTIQRLAAPTLNVANNQITITAVSGATNYEVYKLSSGSSFEKVEDEKLLQNGLSFMLKDLGETAEFTVAVKAVTTNTILLNSNLSESVSVAKLGKTNAFIQNGNVKISLPSGCAELVETGNVLAVLNININGVIHNCEIAQDFATNVAGITWSSSEKLFNVYSGLVFNYAENYIIGKNISITLQLTGKQNNKYYIYSDKSENVVRGLFAPTNTKVDKIDASIEKLSWSNNGKNKLSVDGELVGIDQYVFTIVYEGKTYYSNDVKLKYLNGGIYNSYGAITSTNVAFPYGYDANNDGDFTDEGDVIFNNGEYKISVAAIADGYASSPFSPEYRFTILNQTVMSIQEGKLVWENVAGAEKYILRIRNTSNSIVLEKEISTLIYDFEDFDLSGLHTVTVQALTSNADMLNSKESAPLSVYRLKTATDIAVDNGMLKVTASPFIYAIYVEYNGRSIIYQNPKQEDNLKSVTNILGFLGAEDVQYIVDLTASFDLFNNASGKIKVRLCGNTGTIDVPIVGTVGMANSKTIEDQTTAVVLSTNVNTVSKGSWKFSQNVNLGSLENKVDINYNFNNDSSVHSFWKDAIVYQIQIDTYGQGDNKTDIIYAVDYYRFKEAVNEGTLSTTSSSTYYEICDGLNGLYAKLICDTNLGKIYFNVYFENIINLQDFDNLYYYPVVFDNVKYLSPEGVKSLDLALGGSFVVKIRTIGGDDSADSTYSYINSYAYELQPFVRFGQSYLSTSSGQLVFANLAKEDCVSPVYKVTIYEWNDSGKWCIYLYNEDECTEEQVRTKFNLTNVDNCEPIIFVDEGKVAFEVSEYFGSGIYRVDVQALAGIGADDYLLNAKKPNATYVIKILTSTNPQLEDGNLTFDLSYANLDGEYSYAYVYELVVEHDSEEYKTQISSSTPGVVVEGTKLTYTLPDQIGGLSITSGKTYKIKVRAMAQGEGFINAKFYDGNNDKVDDYLSFGRVASVTNVRIEDGILKWVGDSSSSKYLIKLDYYDNGYKSIVITTGYVKSNENYYYIFNDTEYTVHGLSIKSYISSGVDYSISVSKLGNSTNMISSSYTEITNVFRLESVLANEVVANNGILTWTKISDAVGYKVEFVGSVNYTYTIASNINSLDLSAVADDLGNILNVGSYTIKITSMGSSKINSKVQTGAYLITKLSKPSNVKLLGDSVTWNEDDLVNNYKVKFIYNGKTTEQTISGNLIATPTDVVGKLQIEIVALGDSLTLLNSDKVVIESSLDTPSPVVELSYNTTFNRFEWKTQADFVNTDHISVSYEFAEYTENYPSGNGSELKKITISYMQDGYYDSDKGVYYLPISVMGYYRNFTVRVQRVNAVDSAAMTMSQEVKWFKYGGGTAVNPYVLNNMESLLNIRYYPTAHYKLLNDITITSYGNGPLLTTEFKGTIFGEGYKIDLGTISLTDVKEFALFKSLNGANIEKLDVQANITNSISNIEDDINMSILAVSSQSSRLTNVRVLSSSITIKDDADNAYDMSGKTYIGGVFAKDSDSTLSGCSIEISISNNFDNEDYVYFGGVVGYSLRTVVQSNSSIKSTVSYVKNDIRYLGGVAGYYLGNDETQSTGVTNSTIELNAVNITALYTGGVFGYARTATVKNNTINGTITRQYINSNIYFGGAVGTAVSCLMHNNAINATITLSLQTISGTQRIGLVAGSLEIYSSAASELKGDYAILNNQTTLYANTTLELGLYGYKTEGVVVDKDYTE